MNHRGQSVVELALITPLLLVALYVPFDFGLAIYAAQLTQNAVRDTARMASATDAPQWDTNALKAKIAAGIPASLTLTSSSVELLQTSPANCSAHVTVSATVSYNFFWYRMMRMVGFDVPTVMTFTRTTQMRYERQPDGTTSTLCTA